MQAVNTHIIHSFALTSNLVFTTQCRGEQLGYPGMQFMLV